MSICKLTGLLQKSILNDVAKHTFTLSQFRSKSRTSSSRGDISRYTERSHTCGQVTIDDVGQRASLFGWVTYSRFDNRIISLRDSYGSIQCILDKDIFNSNARKMKIPNESVLKVSGTIQRRAPEHINPNDENGKLELVVDELILINRARSDLPILTRDNEEHTLENRLKHRYLDLRGNRMQEALRSRSTMYQILRKRLVELGFVECDTPTLYRRTPGGANEFIVPSQMNNKFYSLTQSPQQLKQLLMISGLDRYFQICRCYRDESCRTDRQPEFTQLDIELSFTNQNLVMRLVDDIVYNLLSSMNNSLGMNFNLDSLFSRDQSIQRITYQQAMENYGTDKPDLRFDWIIENCNEGIRIELPSILHQEVLDRALEIIRTEKLVESELPPIRLRHETDSTTISVDDGSVSSRKFLGLIRLQVARELMALGHGVYNYPYKFVWVTDFPLFEMDAESRRIQSSHHPFTAPSADTAPLLESYPLEVIGQHFDLVLNGQEIAGGSIRNHDAKVQQFIFDEILKVDKGTFEYFIDALKSGCPPHGGIAFGLDRLIALLLNRDSIREVIAFPKSNTGRDIMTDTPHEVDIATRKVYHLK